MNKTAFLFALIVFLSASVAIAEDERINALTVFATTAQKTPVGGIGVYKQEYGKRIGTIETLSNGSTVLRGDYGRIIAKVSPRRASTGQQRIEVRER